ncbi:GNAT family N-acetyltransferase [Streptomyces sp. NPDC014882]|uniref:GNAT family N-acetyltransferase n=1 Tax=Streptomyces sp. NPDC014882 TaxID=3364927 RepID=UPI003702AD6D
MAESRLAFRAVVPGDRTALERMHRRCSEATRYHRFQTRGPGLPESYLDTVLSESAGATSILATDGPPDHRRVVALASMAPVSPGVAELGVLVEDGWQRRGIGRLLVRQLVGVGRGQALHALTAQTLTTRRWILGLLRDEVGGAVSYGPMSDTVRITAFLEPVGERCG